MTGWLVAGLAAAAMFGPGLPSLVRLALRARLRQRESLREADEVDAAWRDSLPDVAVTPWREVFVPEPPTAPLTRPLPRFRGEPL